MTDGLSPSEIGTRTTMMLRRLSPLAPAMSNWRLLDGSGETALSMEEPTPVTAALVEANVWEDDWGRPDPRLGYSVVVRGAEIVRDEGTPDTIDVAVTAGSKWFNRVDFEVGAPQLPKDFNLITYPIYRGALEAIVSAWPCPWAIAYTFCPDVAPVDADTTDRRSPFDAAWIGYLSAPLAMGVKPSPALKTEPTPGGGVIISAVEARIDPSDAQHMRRSRMLEAIMIDAVGVEKGVTAVSHPARVGPY
jgi:hypothetical protein